MGKGKLTEHAQNLQGCEKCNLRSVLAKGPNFAVTPKHPPNLEYITAIEAACTKLS